MPHDTRTELVGARISCARCRSAMECDVWRGMEWAVRCEVLHDTATALQQCSFFADAYRRPPAHVCEWFLRGCIRKTHAERHRARCPALSCAYRACELVAPDCMSIANFKLCSPIRALRALLQQGLINTRRTHPHSHMVCTRAGEPPSATTTRAGSVGRVLSVPVTGGSVRQRCSTLSKQASKRASEQTQLAQARSTRATIASELCQTPKRGKEWRRTMRER